MSIASKGKGKSGGARVITLTAIVDVESTEIGLLYVYDKSERESITDKELQKIIKANEPKMITCNLYDDWTESINSFTAFIRLILIFRSIHVNQEKAKMILKPDKSVVTLDKHLWPNLTQEQWINAEIELKNLILQDYGKKNYIN